MTHDLSELAAMLAEDERMAMSFRDCTLADEQAVAIDYYEARPFGDEEEGLSQVVTPDVAEVVDYMTISTSRTIVAGDRVVEFESAEADHQDAAEEATAAVMYSFMKQQATDMIYTCSDNAGTTVTQRYTGIVIQRTS